MNLEALRKKVGGEEPIYVEKTKEEKAISLREIASGEKEELSEIIDQMAKLREKRHEIHEERRKMGINKD